MIPMELLSLKEYACNESEYHKRDNLLYHLELNECVWSSISDKAYFVCGHHQRILKERYSP